MNRSIARQVALTEAERWFALGEPVAELAYLGRGKYEAHATTVTRVTTSMIFTASGRRFWRYTNAMNEVGSRDRQIITANALVFRIVPIDHPRAAPLLAGGNR
ncbi:hypothetical protein BDK92_7086 [Micromonospora pisi]|uniref:Uncharacterized protein n=1 Tax=Micromonospora pisi TaxID=589240 RepID=A0A495JWL2_9ACTN|nr:hypothetical protein [Micromonospora pisi]RKR92644.1 hypothetical protein BDK92_7086 [Micromonospora pisi]